MKLLDIISSILLIIGGLNWGLVGMLDLDLVAQVFGSNTTLARVVYDLVGLSALYQAICWQQIQCRWNCKK